MYPEVSLFIDGEWGDGTQRRREPVLNPATEEIVGHVAYADQTDLDRALAAADAGFLIWRRTSAQERYVILRKAAAVLRERQEVIAKLLTLEQGKPLAEAMSEISIGVESWSCPAGASFWRGEGQRLRHGGWVRSHRGLSFSETDHADAAIGACRLAKHRAPGAPRRRHPCAGGYGSVFKGEHR